MKIECIVAILEQQFHCVFGEKERIAAIFSQLFDQRTSQKGEICCLFESTFVLTWGEMERLDYVLVLFSCDIHQKERIAAIFSEPSRPTYLQLGN